MARYNVAIVGQTGVGKSSLINYLYGENVAKTGIGKPVTTNGFHPIDIEINGLSVTLFDSWGLEVGKAEQWLEELENELKKRSVHHSADNWFHSIFYCIQAGGLKVQQTDIDIINKFKSEHYKISVILTKADQISEDDEIELSKAIEKEIPGVSIIPICGVEKKTRSGITQPFGKKEIEIKAFEDFIDSLIQRLPLRCESIMKKLKEKWLQETELLIGKIDRIGSNETDIRKDITTNIKKLQENLTMMVNAEISKTMSMYGDFAKKLDYTPVFQVETDQISFEKVIDDRGLFADFEWYEYPVAVPLLSITVLAFPLYLVYDAVTGNSKSDIQKTIRYEVRGASDTLEKDIKRIINEIKFNLQIIKDLMKLEKI